MNQINDYLREQFRRPHTLPLSGVGSTLLVLGLILRARGGEGMILLVYLGVALMIFALIHQWRSPSLYGTLFAVSVIAFPVLLLIHNICETLNENLGEIPVLFQFLGGISVVAFVGSVIVSPAAALVGMVAGLYYLIKSKFE